MARPLTSPPDGLHLAPGTTRAARRGSLRVASGPLPGRRARLRRHLPGAARRRRPDVGGPDARRSLRGAAVAGARAGRGHRYGRRHLARPARGPAVGPRRVRPATPLRARGPRPGARLRGALPAARRAAAAAAGNRGRDPRRNDLQPDLRRGARPGDLPARTGVEQDLLLQDDLHPHPGPHRPRHRPAGLWLLVEAGARRLRRLVLRPLGARLHGRDGDRASAPGGQLDGRSGRGRARAHTARAGRRRSASWRRPWPFGAAASWCRW